MRRDDPLLGKPAVRLDGAVLAEHAFVLRFFSEDDSDRLLAVNLGRTLHLDPAPEPLLAPPLGMRWRVLWSSEDPRYGGLGTPPLDACEVPRSPPQKPSVKWAPENWRLTAECAVVLAPVPL